MFFLKREQKMMLFWFSIMCLTAFPNIPFIGAILNIPTCFLLSEYTTIKKSWRALKRPWLSLIFSFIVIGVIAFYIFSPHYHELGLMGVISVVEFEIISKYLVLILALTCASGEITFRNLLKVTYIGMLLLTFFGLLNLISGRPLFLEMIFAGSDNNSVSYDKVLQDTADASDRMRVHSMFVYAFDYGYICLVSILFAFYGIANKYINRTKGWTIVVCGIIGVVICACRTIYVCTLVAMFIYMMVAIPLRNRILILASFVIVSAFAFFLIPKVQEMAYLMFSAFDMDSDVEGSSLASRIIQYQAVYYHVQDHIIFGNGYKFFEIDMGYAERDSGRVVDEELLGLEGIGMQMLLERGLFGLFVYLFFYFVLMLKIYILHKVDKRTAACSISILVAYLLFANFTGELHSVPPTLFITGILLHKILCNIQSINTKKHAIKSFKGGKSQISLVSSHSR